MTRKISLVLAVILLLVISVTTLMATFVIESIIWTGIICAIVAICSAIFALIAKQYRIAIAGFLVPLVAIGLFVAEASFLQLGPRRAALPFCVTFLVIQALVTLMVLTELQSAKHNGSKTRVQLSVRTLLIGTALFAMAFATVEYFPTRSVPFVSDWSLAIERPYIAATSFAMGLITIFGLVNLTHRPRQAATAGTRPG